MQRLRIIFSWIKIWPVLLCYWLISQSDKEKLKMDLNRLYQVQYKRNYNNFFLDLYKTLIYSKPFRSIYYLRIGKFKHFVSFLLPGMGLCGITATKSKYVGGGVYIQHGWSMVLDAESVGENLWINQNVTVGYRGNGHPRIGNNVRIGSGAVVLGNITIGDNVNIGANAIVVKDVPSNCTVVSPPAFIVKKNGEKVNESL